jgi:hypothetical protein
MALSKSEVFEAVKAANLAAFSVGGASGCGRAYVVMTCEKEELKHVVAACKKIGLMFLTKAYGTSGNAIYIGYDNASGRTLAKSRAMAEALNARGLRCYDDSVAD